VRRGSTSDRASNEGEGGRTADLDESRSHVPSTIARLPREGNVAW
jgi:hypothetical protein